MLLVLLFLAVLQSAFTVHVDVQAREGCPRYPTNTWYRFKDSCYMWSGLGEKENWFQSELTCRKYGGHLVSIGSEEENEIVNVLSQCYHNAWIGRVNTNPSMRTSFNGYSWWDGRKTNYSSHSYSSSGNYDCVYAEKGTWRNTYCEGRRTYVCKVRAHPDDASAAAAVKHCPDGWHSFQGHCYKASDDKTNYFHAQLSCEDEGASVISVLSPREQTFLNMLVGCDTAVWLGLERANPCVAGSSSNCWEWLDRHNVTYTSWASGNPSSNTDVECAYSKGLWYSQLCTNKFQFVCKKDGGHY